MKKQLNTLKFFTDFFLRNELSKWANIRLNLLFVFSPRNLIGYISNYMTLCIYRKRDFRLFFNALTFKQKNRNLGNEINYVPGNR